MVGKDTELLRWLGYSVEALSQHGLYVTGGDPAALDAAKKARKAAGDVSPAASNQLTWFGE